MKRSLYSGLLPLSLAFLLTVTTTARAQVAGAVEGYNANLSLTGSFYVGATAVQPDGKTIIGGNFTTVGGSAHTNIARINVDGSVDASFTTSAIGQVTCVAVQADGKILLGGGFTTVNGTTLNRIARLNADGSLDATFNHGTGADNWVSSVVVQADGKILLGGQFTKINDQFRNRMARLNADGSLETTFISPSINGDVNTLAVQPDGKIVFGGAFTPWVFFPDGRNRIARLNADGSVDATFNPGTGANDTVTSVALQADGKILLGGAFTIYNGTANNRMARLHPDGSLESGATFSVGTGADESLRGPGVQSVAVQADGKILLGGTFTTFNGMFNDRNHIARLLANGNLESTATFNIGSGANDTVYGVALQGDGKIVLCGTFANVNGSSRNKVARLANDAAPQTVSAPDRTQVLWSRGGSAPEVGPVTFEVSTNGGTVWTPLGAGTRVGTTPNWQLTGLSLPPSGQVRARGRTAGGLRNGSSGLVETVGSFTLPAITVAQVGVVADGGSVPFGTAVTGSSTPLTFTINNSGSASLTGLAVTKDGTDNAAFTVSALSATSIPVGAGTATFTVTFSSTTSGPKTAALHIASNLTGSLNPYDINLSGLALSSTQDTDGDGLNDASEFQMAALGYNWQVGGPAQTALVNTYNATANGAGYFTPAQVQALHIGTPLIQRHPTTGVFTLTIGVEKSTTLAPLSFAPFSMLTAPGAATSLNGAGKLEFQFTSPDNAAFFQLRAE